MSQNLLTEMLEASTYDIRTEANGTFMGNLLQEFTIKYTDAVPTAGLVYRPTTGFRIEINPNFFSAITRENRTAVLKHEIMHFTNNHILRFMEYISKDQRTNGDGTPNIAMDMAINQYIQDLPQGCVDVSKFVMVDDKNNNIPMPLYQTAEFYYDQLKDGKNKQANKQQMEAFGEGFDKHDFEDLSEEDKERMLKDAKKLLERTIEKTQFTHSIVPNSIKDLLREIEAKINQLNYKQILKNAIKKTVAVQDRESTWYRPNKRYSEYAPGTRVGKLPKIETFIDTSGSISHKEANQFLSILQAFLKVGAKECKLGLWNTELYFYKKYKKNQQFNHSDIQSGGTDPDCVLNFINNNPPDLTIILTDGFYDSSKVKLKDMVKDNVIWIISHNGNINHPNKHIGKTIPLKGIEN